jgi:hypothetical protein
MDSLLTASYENSLAKCDFATAVRQLFLKWSKIRKILTLARQFDTNDNQKSNWH